MSRSGVAGLCGRYMFHFLKNYQTVFQSSSFIYIPISSAWDFLVYNILVKIFCGQGF